MFKYDWIWEKTRPSNPMLAKKRPLSYHETISVFGRAAMYTPQMTNAEKPNNGHGKKIRSSKSETNGIRSNYMNTPDSKQRYPKSIIKFDRGEIQVHPTQKPVALMEYLIKTYTLDGETVLDFTAGSFTTGVACVNLDRRFIGIEMDKGYFEIGVNRIKEAMNGR